MFLLVVRLDLLDQFQLGEAAELLLNR